MKTAITILFVVLLISNEIRSQVVTGKLVDENGAGLAGVPLQLYAAPNVYNATSSTGGIFSFNIITSVEDNQLPTSYSVSNNFPNPFNPRTRISITLPSRENVKAEVFNLLGQSVTDMIEATFDAGTNYIDLELKGLPNGFYISRITIENKYTVSRKLMLLYGSQHLNTGGAITNLQLNKSFNTKINTDLDSLVATNNIIGRKTFTNLPSFVSGTLDLGNLIIERYCPGTPTVLYEGKTYNTVIIGTQCWLRENLDIGTQIIGSQNQTNGNGIEKYCYDDQPANCTNYGGLYQWNEAMQYVTNEGAQGICPVGWHLPSNSEFETLANIVNWEGNELKREDQGSGSGQGTNTTGFSALLAGYRNTSSTFYELGEYTYFWISKESDANSAYGLWLRDFDSYIYRDSGYFKNAGFSVRCIKD